MEREKTLFAMDLTALMTVEELSEKLQKPAEEVLISFMESKTGKMLYDDSTKLWWDGPSSCAERFEKEKN